ncbi:unnamed protein product [Clavelina lepadiformis]|uniref:Uncharacterized protein n=1 Tax=Clavelina lepadiformis TaxID=159417 RepID=A0ABP0GVV9_CLALP
MSKEYVPHSTWQYLEFVDEVEAALRRLALNESTLLLGDFVHMELFEQRKRPTKSDSITDCGVKDHQTKEDDILDRWREYYKDFLNTGAETPTDTQTICFGEESGLTEAKVTQAVRSLAERCGEIRPAMSRGRIHWLTCVCQVELSSDKTPRDWKMCVINPIQKKDDKK